MPEHILILSFSALVHHLIYHNKSEQPLWKGGLFFVGCQREHILGSKDPDEVMWMSRDRMFTDHEWRSVRWGSEVVCSELIATCARFQMSTHQAATWVDKVQKLFVDAEMDGRAKWRSKDVNDWKQLHELLKDNGYDIPDFGKNEEGLILETGSRHYNYPAAAEIVDKNTHLPVVF